MTKERIVFMGTPEFAVASLRALVEAGENIVGVITAPDRKSGRGMKLTPSAVKQFAVQHGILVLQPTNLKSEAFLKELNSLNATLQIVVAFRMLPEVVWNMPPKGTFNLHASLLPQYRGAAPINWAVINGEKETGVTTFFLQHKIDTGNIIFQEKLTIAEDETAGELHDRLMNLGAKVVVKTVHSIAKDENPDVPQISSSELKEAPKIFKETCRIDWNKPAIEVHNFIRGLSPYPTAFTVLKKGDEELAMKVFRSNPQSEKANTSSGKIRVEERELFVSSNDNWLRIDELQLAGKKRMKASDFLLGFQIDIWQII